MDRQRLAGKLQTPAGNQMITSQQHAEVLSSMSTFYTNAVEVLRMKLVSHGAAISNMANIAQRQRVGISTIEKNSL